MSERDTQFAGFAKALFDELPDVPDGSDVDEWSTACEQIIARRAYDLVTHCFDEMNPIAPQACETTAGMLEGIPDMTTLPEVKQSE